MTYNGLLAFDSCPKEGTAYYLDGADHDKFIFGYMVNRIVSIGTTRIVVCVNYHGHTCQCPILSECLL